MTLCVACAASVPDASVAIGGARLRACRGCTHHWVTDVPEAAASAETLYGADYKGFERDEGFEATLARMIRDEFAPRLARGARILDVGCGNGAFLDAGKAAGYVPIGQDVSAAAVEHCRSLGHEAVVGSLDDATRVAPVDAVTMWDVIEHVPRPAEFLMQSRRLLRPGGLLFVKTPDVPARLVAAARLHPRLVGPLLQVPAHLQFFTARSLAAAAAQAGFTDVQIRRAGPLRSAKRIGGLGRIAKRETVRLATRALGGGNLLLWARA